ncbi:MAG: HD domain-containing protein [Aromatoleum sp.]|uniref:HD domain-containing protein n=1 Tax=Aromatoleum sp. TaxID=2307007 RepID=UPI002893C3ED|nr:HD domain-containing protein [Aromatoleum sp.]MDT3670792.1 HD domain-containing protein [Aromatoleum sp.]
MLRVIKMLLIHDIVEIDAGDMPLHEATDPAGQAQRERAAAERIFGLLPAGLTTELRALWFEFEAGETGDAQFAKALDRFQPVLHNAATGGGTGVESSVSLEQVKSRCGPPIERGASTLWAAALELVESHYRAPNDRNR